MKLSLSPQKIIFLYALGFFVVVSLAFIPGFTDAHGKLFGLYHIDPIDHVLHSLSGVWAVYAGLKSLSAIIFFFRTFGTIYFLDGLSGLLTGYNFLNLHFLTSEPAVEVTKRLPVNAPHILIGGSAMVIGWYLYKKKRKKNTKR